MIKVNDEFEFNNELAIEEWSEDDAFLEEDFEDNFGLAPKDKKNHEVYVNILKSVLPHIGSNETKIIVTEIMVALKLEGLLGKNFSKKEKEMVNVLKNAILEEPIRKHQAIKFARKLLKEE